MAAAQPIVQGINGCMIIIITGAILPNACPGPLSNAAGALLSYVTSTKALVIGSGSLEVELFGNSGQHMFLDPSAVECLELVRTSRAGQGGGRRSSSLFGMLDHTQTVCGARLLKTSILQPFTHTASINTRLDSLQVGACRPGPGG
jgi:DNA mismatch repair ATPase MutS